MEKRENMLRKEVQDAREECMQKLGKQEAERENIEKTLRKEVRDIKRECMGGLVSKAGMGGLVC